MPRPGVHRETVIAFLRDQERHRTRPEIALGTGVSQTRVRDILIELDGEGRLHADQGRYPYAYLLLPPPEPPDISRFYLTDLADPHSPKSLNAYTTPHRGTVWPGDRVAYINPELPGRLQLGTDPLTVTALVDFGGGYPPQAILNDGLYEVSAANLRCLSRGEIAVADARTSDRSEPIQEDS